MDLLLIIVIAIPVVLFLGGLRHRRPADYDEVGFRSSMPLWLFGGWMFWGAGYHSNGDPGASANSDLGGSDFHGSDSGGSDLGGGGGDMGGSF